MIFITIFTSCLLFTIIKSLSPETIDLSPIIPLPISAFSIAIVASILLAVFYGLSQLKKEFTKANLTKNQTYLDFMICVSALLFILFEADLLDSKKVIFSLTNLSLIFAVFFLMFSIIGIYLKCCTKKLDVTKLKRRFAPEASNDDNLNFKESAKEAAIAIAKSEKYVSVVALNGGYGEGKSSYARMIIEEISAEKSLYTYISLTESNATQDFSQIFANRWFETLNERYPSINLTPHIASLEAILRESTNHSALFVAISKILVKLNFGLNKTITKCFDENAQKEKDKFVLNSTAAMFNNISEIKEELWIINIDEIERAQLDEIYHVIEVIERFKNEGRFGLPVKLVFLLCVSGSDLEQRLKDLKEKGFEKAQLIEDFFFNNPKSRDKNLFLPPISYEKKKEFVVNSLNNVLKNEKFGLEEINKIPSYPSQETTKKFFDEEEALGWIIDYLIKESPRTIAKVCQELEFFYNCFRDLEEKFAAKNLAICDAITISLIKIKYPFLIEVLKFWTHQHESVLIEFNDLRDNQKERKERVLKFIKKALSNDEWTKAMATEKIDQYIDLLCLIYRPAITHSLITTGVGFNRRSSDKETLSSVLSFKSNNNFQTSVKTYFSEDHKSAVKNLSNENILKYSHDLSNTTNASYEKHLDVASEIFTRLEGSDQNKKFTICSANFVDSDYKSASDKFLSAISYALERGSQENYKEIWELVKQFLASEKIAVNSKYIFLNAFANQTRSRSITEIRLQNLFKDLTSDEEIKLIIKSVFEDAKNRYFKGNKSVYANEENYAYLLYQSWNGKNDTPKNYSAITKAAIRDLENYPKVIECYWKDYAHNKDFEIISLKDLYEITKKSLEITQDQPLRDMVLQSLESFKKIRK